jgi:Tfp pilus assembly protein PilP
MKLTTGILLLGMAAGTAWGQNPDVIENTRNTLKAVEQKKAMDSNAALAASQGQAPKPATPASTQAAPVKPAATASSKPAAPAKPAATSKPAGKPAATSKPTASASAPAKPAPQTSLSSAKPASNPSQSKATTTGAAAGKNVNVAPKPTVKTAGTPAVKPAAKPTAAKTKIAVAGKPKRSKQKVAVKDKKNPAEAKKEVPKKINLTGRRDPFVSPVVNRSMVGSGCSTGKRCLAIDQISLKGVVKAEAGMIAVVVNAMNKAYFLRENDPVFNGYVVKITGDSIIFKETLQDRLGKPFTREVTKRITTPAV